MTIGRPPGLVPDTSLPEQLGSIQDARKYIGSKVCRLFSKEELGEAPARWYVGTINAVALENETFYFTVVYDDNDSEEFWWEDVRQWAVVEPRAGTKPCKVSMSGRRDSDAAAPQATRKTAKAAAHHTPPTDLRPGPASASARSSGAAAAAVGPVSRKRPLPSSQPHPDASAAPAIDQQVEVEHDDRATEGPQLHPRTSVRRRLVSDADNVGQTQHAGAADAPRRTIGGLECKPAGHLFRIQLTNFMNHDNFELLFNDHLTFVSGRNGSGKSALLQGLQACLGVSARETGRGTTIGDWVHIARRQATATLELWNSTDQECSERQQWTPFRHEIYGSMIRIVRKITAGEPNAAGRRPGTATYQLYRADGREVKPAEMGHSAAKEVAALAAHFNMDGANPLIVITQDRVKTFHEPPKPGQGCPKYAMYMEGTCLAATRDTLADSQQKLAQAEANVAARREQLAAKERELRALEQRQRQLEQADELKHLVSDLECAMVWAAVAEAREELKNAKAGAAGGPARVAALEAQVAEDERAEADLQAQEQQQVDVMEQSRADPRRRIEELNGLKSRATQQMRGLNRQRVQCQSQIDSLRDSRGALEDELREQQSEEPLRRLREHEEKVEAANAELVAIQAHITQAEAQRANLEARRCAAVAAQTDKQAACAAARAALQEAQAALRELAAAGGGAAANDAVLTRRWGAGAMRLLAAVRGARPGTFSALPIGPVGMYLRRSAACGTDPRVAAALEVALGPVLDTWLVASWADSSALRDLADRLRVARPTTRVVPYKARVHRYGAEPVVDGTGRRWLRVMEMVEPVEGLEPTVRCTLVNCLLDSAAAGIVTLVDDAEVGRAVALQRVPGLAQRQVYKAYDLQGYCYERKGAAMLTSGNALPRTLRLSTDNRAQLEEAQREVDARAADLQQAEAALREAGAELGALEREKKDGDAHLQQLTRAKRQAEARLAALRSDAPLDTEAASADILNRIQATESQLVTMQQQLDELDSQANNLQQEARQANESIEVLQQQAALYAQRREEMMAQLTQLGRLRAAAAAALEARKEELEGAREAVRRAQEGINRAEARADQVYCVAARVCCRDEGLEALERVRRRKEEELADKYPNRSGEQREALLQQAMTLKGLSHWSTATRAAVERAEREAGGDLQAITIRAEAARREVAVLQSAVEAVSKKMSAMREAQVLRRSNYQGLRKKIDRLSSIKFGDYMRRRQFIAEVKVDHEEEELTLSVRKANEGQSATSLLQLSGGERSFTTSSFLLAMGEVLLTPFRAMDEYDVYLDTDRRKMATMSLMEYAWKVNPDSQLVLLSPQDTSVITESFRELLSMCQREGREPPPPNFLKIVRLPDPRGRGVGGGQQQS